jgi:hypothetical protein
LVKYLAFDRLAERTTAELQLRKALGKRAYDPDFERYMEKLLPIAKDAGIKMITNAGGDDPEAVVEAALQVCKKLGRGDIRIAAPRTEDPLPAVLELDPLVLETGQPMSQLGGEIIGATAYFGAQQIVEGLEQGADLVITGRVGDSTLYMAPMVYEQKWSWRDWNRLAGGMALGHLMECGGQVTGGYFASPPYKIVPGLARIGLPYAEVNEDGSGVITKAPDTGGMITVPICKEQMLYEVGDPSRYVHPDVIVDWTTAALEQVGPDRVLLSGVTGHPAPDSLKVLITVREGYLGECYVQFGGSDAFERAKLGVEVIEERLTILGIKPVEFRAAYLGIDSLFAPWKEAPGPMPREVTVHLAGRFEEKEEAETFVAECFIGAGNHYGPAGGTAGRKALPVDETPNTYTVLIPKESLNEPEVFITDSKLGGRVYA